MDEPAARPFNKIGLETGYITLDSVFLFATVLWLLLPWKEIYRMNSRFFKCPVCNWTKNHALNQLQGLEIDCQCPECKYKFSLGSWDGEDVELAEATGIPLPISEKLSLCRIHDGDHMAYALKLFGVITHDDIVMSIRLARPKRFRHNRHYRALWTSFHKTARWQRALLVVNRLMENRGFYPERPSSESMYFENDNGTRIRISNHSCNDEEANNRTVFVDWAYTNAEFKGAIDHFIKRSLG